jgi:hypothetical protein
MKKTIAFAVLLAGTFLPAAAAQTALYSVVKSYSAGDAFWDYGAYIRSARE